MYRTVAQLDSVMATMKAFFPDLCDRFTLPNNSIEGRAINYACIHGGPKENRRGVLIVGGMHGRELINPDAIVELQLDLVRAYLNGHGLSYGEATWTANDIRSIVESLDIFLLPCANPDGREFAMFGIDKLWRENRRDNANTPCDGVDLNRNCDFMWAVTGNATCNPCSWSRTFVGSAPFSEPESKNLEYLCDSHRIEVFLDVHSFTELVLYPWGHAQTQTNDTTKRFTGLPSGMCQGLTPPNHQEYMTPRDYLRFTRVADRITDAIYAVRKHRYTPKPIYGVYNAPTSGTSSDYVYSRHIKNPALGKVYGFAFETGPDLGQGRLLESFQPDDSTWIKREAKAGMLSLLHQSICGIDFIGESFLGSTVGEFTDVREIILSETEDGREWIDLFERVQGNLLGLVLADEKLVTEAIDLFERVKKLLKNKRAVVSLRDIRRGIEFLDELSSRTSKDIRRDISKVQRQLKKAEGKRVDSVLKELSDSRPWAKKKSKGKKGT